MSSSKNKGDENKGPSPFDYSKSILNYDKPIAMSPQYVPFIVNRAVAHHRDCIYICQLLNEYQVEPEQHYAFLFNEVSKYRRPFEKWVSSKKDNEDVSDLELISKYYNCSIEVAREYLALYTPESLSSLKAIYGGVEHRKT